MHGLYPDHENDLSDPFADINVTPLVDVMLVLMITFMIAMPVLTYTIPIHLPSSQHSPISSSLNKPLRLTITRDSQYFIGDQAISLDKLAALLSKEAKANPDAVLAISADENVDYKYVIAALDIAQKTGVKKIGFVTEPRSQLPSPSR